MALVTAMLLISGQILTCCGLNESLAGSFARMLGSMGVPATIEAGTGDQTRIHPTCHGHSEGSETGLASEAYSGAAGTPSYHSRETCLNEMALPVKAQASGFAAPSDLFAAPKPESLVALSPVKSPLAGSRPSRNDTGPPVYLRTLRILV